MNEHITIVKCPTCQTSVIWSSESKYRPFCSRRCKLIDLGEWAEERYSVEAVEDDSLSDLLK
ncbi:DNA gyrase inhibitor YacG [Neisseria weixii]|uniref:DNA gyrase inhibitor YacG n=1 Tax=Neisseria weixii TaxID=1853276 RepID=A0A3N4NFE9_9NEIS|nr:DNA gyrase inhibitor YacG [Neisseria weixii]ATD65763.1 DNA gyrase inhibitor YacG [Neisseria weixii]RPD90850.1 DNA gyrase inhibitor YacG [Neisseria weixii]RPD91044.1 DNA gyrase inhibitor YacG [Neisseria weixii]